MDKDPKTGQFLMGHTGMGGRPKGSRTKLGEAFITALQKDFEANGEVVIQEVRATKPGQYLKVIASLLPKQFELPESELGKFTDEQLGQLFAALNAWLAQNGTSGDGEADIGKPAGQLQTLQ